MKLMVLYVDNWSAWNLNQMPGGMKHADHRLVEIVLTPEQQKQLTPRRVGESAGKPRFENVGTLWLQPDTEEESQ